MMNTKRIEMMIVGLLLGSILAGCHTIHPRTQPDDRLVESISKKPLAVGLVMEANYRKFKSKDRGDAFADPQTYYVGEALAPLTTSFFNQGFQTISVYERFPNKSDLKGEDYVVHMRLLDFDNELIGIVGMEQEISVSLEAKVYDRELKLLRELRVNGYEEGRIGVFSSSKDSQLIVSLALQKALLDMIRKIEEVLIS